MVAAASSYQNTVLRPKQLTDPAKSAVGFSSYRRKQRTRNVNQKDNDPNNNESAIHAAHGDFINQYQSQLTGSPDDNLFEPDWYEKHEDLFKVDWDKSNFIHRVIKELRGELPDRILGVIQRMVLEKPDSFTSLDSQGKSPLLHAANFNPDILFFIIDILIPETVIRKINLPCSDDEKDCPLSSISGGRKRQCLIDQNTSMEERDVIGERFDNITQNHGMPEPCLHGKIHSEKLIKEDQRLRTALQNALSSVAEQAYPCLESILQAKNFDEGEPEVGDGEATIAIWLGPFKTFLQLCPNSVFKHAPVGKLTPLQMAVDLYRTEDLDYALLFEFVQALIERAPWSIFTESMPGGNETTAYKIVRELKHSEDSSRKSQIIGEVEELLKRTCIGYQGKIWDTQANELAATVTSEEKMSYLYSKVEHEKQFCLNLAGESEVIDREYIERIKKYSRLRFETVLEFVRLPYWKPQRAEKAKKFPKDDAEEHKIEPDPYVDLFRYMWDQGTTKIFVLDVDDDGPEAHTNASIREALQGEGSEPPSPQKFEIETWKWKKFDICTETVATAAPTARHVWLWSSGNTAILRGWACGSGLDKMKQLESLTVVINPRNVKDTEDCNKYLETFKSEVSTKCNWLSRENIKIQVHHLYDLTHDASDDGATQIGGYNASQNVYKRTKRPTDWVHELKFFKQFITNLARKSNLQVKVAVIDDGCRLTDDKGTEPTGRSFCADDRAYFAGRCEHGTSMARCIREVCPTASLYIARLDVSRKAENQAFTLESCCKALKWAIAVGVDVVCMSWTFPIKEPGDDSYEDEFRRLVAEAHKKNIILFGSLPDRGPTVQRSDLAPIGLDEVIRIGSATVHGEGVPENRFGEAEFLLPGEENTEGGEVVKGSSYATAYACGLAAAVLLTIRLLKEYSNAEAHEEIMRAEETARTNRGMKRIFERLSPGDSAHQTMNNYVRPYLILGRKADDFDNSETGKQQTLRKIVHDFLLRDMGGFHG